MRYVKRGNQLGWIPIIDDIRHSVEDGVNSIAGLQQAIGNALQTTFNNISDAMNLIKLNILDPTIGQIRWDDVGETLSKGFHEIANVMVQINPMRIYSDLLQSSDLTRHSFLELDKFTGGMVTDWVNVSDLIWRAGRGDPISKTELVKDALFGLKVYLLMVGGPMAVGAFAGNLVGKEACKNSDTKDLKEACQAAFTIVGIAVGGSLADSGAGFSFESQVSETTTETAEGTLTEEVTHKTFNDYLTEAGKKYLDDRLIDRVSQVGVAICQENQWAGAKECQILGRVAADYLKTPEGTDWLDFLATEIPKLGVEELMRNWFPPNSPERHAIERQIRYVDLPGATDPANQENIYVGQLNWKPILAIAGVGVALMAIGS